MPRFYFHLFDDLVSIDEEGKDLPSKDAARDEGIRSARDIACAEVMRGRLNLAHRIEITDEAGTVMNTIWFREVLRVDE